MISQFRAFDLDPTEKNICQVYLAFLICDILLVYRGFISLCLLEMKGKTSVPHACLHLWSRQLTWVLPVRSDLTKLDLMVNKSDIYWLSFEEITTNFQYSNKEESSAS